MADYDWFPERHEERRQRVHEDRLNRANGFHPVYVRRGDTFSEDLAYYQCRRGCGTLVWDIETHIKNVCPKFEPVVGSDA